MNTYKTTSDGLIIHEMPVVGLAVSAAEHEYKMSEWVAENATLRAALEDIGTLAHCVSLAGPINTPDLATAWQKFDRISAMASQGLSKAAYAKATK